MIEWVIIMAVPTWNKVIKVKVLPDPRVPVVSKPTVLATRAIPEDRLP